MMNPVEMAMPSEKHVVAVLESMPEYVALFQKAFPGEKSPVSLKNAGIAIGAFERRLMTPSRWDAFLKGDVNALSDAEKTGFLKFADAGCPACHNGALLGANSYKKLGVVKNWPDSKDQGRVKISKDASEVRLQRRPRTSPRLAPTFITARCPRSTRPFRKCPSTKLASR